MTIASDLPSRLNNRTALAIIVSIVFLEAIVVLVGLRLGSAPFIVEDERVYHQLAINLLDRGTLSYATAPPYQTSYWRTPGFPAFIALIYAVTGRSIYAVRAVQFAGLALSACLLFRFAKTFVPTPAALIAAVICATYPPLVFMAALYGSEIAAFPFLMLVMLAMIRLRQSDRRPVWQYVLFGLGISTLVMIRPVFGLIVFPMAFVAAGSSSLRRWLPRVAATGFGFALLVIPWLIRNSIGVGEPTGAGPSGWELYVSAQQWNGEISCKLLKPEFDVILAEFFRRNDIAAAKIRSTPSSDPRVSPLMRQELEVSRGYARDAGAVLKRTRLRDIPMRVAQRVYWLWSTTDTTPFKTHLWHRFVQVWHVLVFGAIAVGIVIARGSLRRHLFIWLLPLYVTALHFVFHVEGRYTLLARPMLFIYAGVALQQLAGRVQAQRSAGTG